MSWLSVPVTARFETETQLNRVTPAVVKLNTKKYPSKICIFLSRIAWSICSLMQVLHNDVCAVQNAGGCVCGGASSFQKTMYSSKF